MLENSKIPADAEAVFIESVVVHPELRQIHTFTSCVFLINHFCFRWVVNMDSVLEKHYKNL
jgi:hypothetical protein